MRYQGSTRYERHLVDQVRSVMAAGNPVPGGARDYADLPEAQERVVALHAAGAAGPRQQEHRMPGVGRAATGRTARRRFGVALSRPARRRLAPAAAALAVIAVVAGLAVASGTAPGRPAAGRPATAASAADHGIPRFYVTISGLPPHTTAVVHDSLTGRPLSRVTIPGSYSSGAPSITAAGDDREFVIGASKFLPHDKVATVLYLLRAGAGGRSATLTPLPVRLTPAGSPDAVDGIALSPDGSRLGVALQVPTNGFHPRGEIEVFSLRGGRTRAWTAPGDSALPWDPAWTGARQLSFLWQDHIRGPVSNFTARTQVRVLDTAAPGRDLLAARVLATGGGRLGFIQTAFASPGGGPVIASVYRNVPATGTNGTATVRLVALSTQTGKVISVFAARTVPYHGLAQQNTADGSCQILGTDATGQHALVSCPGFGRLDHGHLTPLPRGSAGILAAAW